MSRLYSFGPFQLDAQRRVLSHNNKLVTLPSKAIEVLLVLVKSHGEVVTKNDLMEAVWPDAFVEEGNLTQHIHLLRRALNDKTEAHRYILTVPGRGYSFVATVQETDEEQPPHGLKEEPQNRFDRKQDHVNDRKDLPRNLWDSIVHQRRGLLLGLVFAIAVLVAIIEMLPPAAKYFNNRGVELQGKGQLHSAIGEYSRAILLRPSYAEGHYNLADAYEEIPDYEKAVEEYQKAIDADVTLYAAYNNLARLYILRRKDYEAALKLLDRALSNNPIEDSVKYTIHKNYGWADLGLGNLSRAVEEEKQAIQFDPNRGAAHCLLAKVLVAQGKAAETLREWEICLAYSSQPEVEPEWRNQAQESVSQKEAEK